MNTFGIPSCTECGLCCAANWTIDAFPYTVPNYMIGIDRSPTAPVEYPMKMVDGRCMAFEGKVGRECRCTAYEERPKVCREFTPGCEMCLDLLAEGFMDLDPA